MSKSSSKFNKQKYLQHNQHHQPHSQLQLYSPNKFNANSPQIRPFRSNLDLYQKSPKNIRQGSKNKNNMIFADNFIRRGKDFYNKSEMKKALQQFYKAQKCIKQDKKVLAFRSPISNFQQTKNTLTPRQIINNNIGQVFNQDSPYIQVCYFIGVCLLSLKNYSTAHQYFLKVQKHNKVYKKNLIMLIAITLKNMNLLEQAIQKISQSIQIDPSIDNILFRSQLYLKNNEFIRALNDYDLILQRFQSNIQATKLKMNLLMKLKQHQKAIEHICLSLMTITDPQCIQELRYTKISALIKLAQYQQALQYIQLLQKDFNFVDSRIFYYKGLAYSKINQLNQAVIYFNQSLALNTNSKYSNLSLCELGIHCLKQRDFYQAFAYLRRSQYINDKNQLVDNLLMFVQALTLLMKRNFQQSLKLLNSIKIQTFSTHSSQNIFLKNLYLNTMGFLSFSLCNHKKALQQYSNIKEFTDQIQYASIQYNKKLCEGIIYCNESNQQKAVECFQKSVQYLLRPEPYFYISVMLTQKSIKNMESHQIFIKILDILQNGIKIGTNSHMYFYRSLVYLYLGMDMESLQDIDKAIQISEDNVAKYFHVRGLIFLMGLNYEQASAQFSTALSIDQKYSQVILQKAKCELYQQNYESAYMELQAYRQLHQYTQDEPVWQIMFMLYQKRFNDILMIEQTEFNPSQNLKIKQNIEEIHNICKFYLGRFQQCGPSGKLILALIYQSFSQLLKLIDQAIQLNVGVGPLSPIDLKLLKGYALYKSQKYQQSRQTYQQIQKSLDILQKQEFCEQNQLKLLICKLNTIFVTFTSECLCNQLDKSTKNNELNLKQTLVMLNNLIQQVHDGPILDQLKSFRNCISNSSQSTQHYNLSFFEDRDMLSNFLQPQIFKKITFRLIIPFPKLQILQIQPNREKLLEEFKIKDIQNKPQAPWMRRGQFGVIFTSDLVQANSNLNLETQQASEQNETSSILMKKKLLQDLRLGSNILQKLQKMQKQKQKQK